MSAVPPMPYCPPGVWTHVATRSTTNEQWKWDLGFDSRRVRHEGEMNTHVLMQRRDGTAIHLVCQPMTPEWRRVLKWAAR